MPTTTADTADPVDELSSPLITDPPEQAPSGPGAALEVAVGLAIEGHHSHFADAGESLCLSVECPPSAVGGLRIDSATGRATGRKGAR